MSISLCLIIKDEEKTLNKFLKQLKPFVDEIIIGIDEKTKDNSQKIAKKYTNKIFNFKLNNDFSKARNLSIKKATKDWILWLDPDEKIKTKDLEKITQLTQTKEYLGYRFIQESYINNQIYTCGICKLFKNNKKIKFDYPVHESVLPSIKKQKGKIGKSGILLKHKSTYDLKKAKFYLKLIKIKQKNHPKSSAKKEKGIIGKIIESFLNQL